MHPLISIFSETASRSFPLILVIGREPNTALAISADVGLYDFRMYPRCGFWNISYKMVAHKADLSTSDLKSLCIQRHSSPIIYTDALPIGLPYGVRYKDMYRSKILETQIKQHITNIFAHFALIARVQLVVLSGLHDSGFKCSKKLISQECQDRDIMCINVPFFHGVNNKLIQAALKEQDRKLIRAIVEQFSIASVEPAIPA